MKCKQNIGLRTLSQNDESAQVTVLKFNSEIVPEDSKIPPDLLKGDFYFPDSERNNRIEVDRSTKTVLNPTFTSKLTGAHPGLDEPRRTRKHTRDNSDLKIGGMLRP